MIRDDKILLYIQEMITSIKLILEYTKDRSFEEFIADDMLCSAVQHQFGILGEASSHVPYRFKNQYKKIPWGMMYGLRNHIVHEYFDVDYDILWHIIRHDLPRNLDQVIHMQHNLDMDPRTAPPIDRSEEAMN